LTTGNTGSHGEKTKDIKPKVKKTNLFDRMNRIDRRCKLLLPGGEKAGMRGEVGFRRIADC